MERTANIAETASWIYRNDSRPWLSWLHPFLFDVLLAVLASFSSFQRFLY